MELHIGPTDSVGIYTWSLIYGDSAPDARHYLLRTLNAEEGIYTIDEQNTISIESYLVGDVFLSWFEVLGSFLATRIEHRRAFLSWEIVAGGIAPISTTGDSVMGGDTIPPVHTYPIRVRQHAQLYPKEKRNH